MSDAVFKRPITKGSVFGGASKSDYGNSNMISSVFSGSSRKGSTNSSLSGSISDLPSNSSVFDKLCNKPSSMLSVDRMASDLSSGDESMPKRFCHGVKTENNIRQPQLFKGKSSVLEQIRASTNEFNPHRNQPSPQNSDDGYLLSVDHDGQIVECSPVVQNFKPLTAPPLSSATPPPPSALPAAPFKSEIPQTSSHCMVDQRVKQDLSVNLSTSTRHELGSTSTINTDFSDHADVMLEDSDDDIPHPSAVDTSVPPPNYDSLSDRSIPALVDLDSNDDDECFGQDILQDVPQGITAEQVGEMITACRADNNTRQRKSPKYKPFHRRTMALHNPKLLSSATKIFHGVGKIQNRHRHIDPITTRSVYINDIGLLDTTIKDLAAEERRMNVLSTKAMSAVHHARTNLSLVTEDQHQVFKMSRAVTRKRERVQRLRDGLLKEQQP